MCHLYRRGIRVEIGTEVKKTPVTVLRIGLTVVPMLLCGAGAMAQATQSEGPQGFSPQGFSSISSIKRTYPGGRDDSDLTVQSLKRITKKETIGQGVDPEEGDYDQGDASSGFGE
jgi:hypothetical protein